MVTRHGHNSCSQVKSHGWSQVIVILHAHKALSHTMSIFLVRGTETSTGIGTGTVIIPATVMSAAISKQ